MYSKTDSPAQYVLKMFYNQQPNCVLLDSTSCYINPKLTLPCVKTNRFDLLFRCLSARPLESPKGQYVRIGLELLKSTQKYYWFTGQCVLKINVLESIHQNCALLDSTSCFLHPKLTLPSVTNILWPSIQLVFSVIGFTKSPIRTIRTCTYWARTVKILSKIDSSAQYVLKCFRVNEPNNYCVLLDSTSC